MKKSDYDKALKYLKLSAIEEFDFIMEDLANNIKAARNKNGRNGNMEEMFRKNWAINGFDDCRNYILTQIKIVEMVRKGEATVVEDKK